MGLNFDDLNLNWEDRSGFSWDMSDSEIAKLFGISRQAVWSARRRHDKPESPRKGFRSNTLKHKLSSMGSNYFKDMTLREISKNFGGAPLHVRTILNSLNFPYKRQTRIKFPSLSDLSQWQESNASLAKRLGTSEGYIALYRFRKDIPSSTRLKKILQTNN